MRVLSSSTFATIGGCALGVLLAACSGSQPSGVTSTSLTGTSLAVRPPIVQLHTANRWIAPDIGSASRLLFISDSGTDEVYVLTLPTLELKATIPGFSEPQGMCSNPSGGVWVANTGTEQMLRLSRTGKLLETLDDQDGYPVACAVNPTNGDLAVSNIFDFSGAGEILIYKASSHAPAVETIPTFYYYGFAAYDPKGDLFANGRNASGTFLLGEIPAGSSTGHLITISGGVVDYGGFIQWYRPGNYIAIGDQECDSDETSCIYWVKISGPTGKVIGKTTLENQSGKLCDLVQGVIGGSRQNYIVGSDYEYCGYSNSGAYRWPYPAGGLPTNYNDSFGADVPIGAAISRK